MGTYTFLKKGPEFRGLHMCRMFFRAARVYERLVLL